MRFLGTKTIYYFQYMYNIEAHQANYFQLCILQILYFEYQYYVSSIDINKPFLNIMVQISILSNILSILSICVDTKLTFVRGTPVSVPQ